MLKIKEEIDLKELEKFGYKKIDWSSHPINTGITYEKKGYGFNIVIDNDCKTICVEEFRQYDEEHICCNCENYIDDLIKADLVEKVGDR